MSSHFTKHCLNPDAGIVLGSDSDVEAGGNLVCGGNVLLPPAGQPVVDLQGGTPQEWFEGLSDTGASAIAHKLATFEQLGHCRDLTCLDLFSGDGAVAAAFTAAGHSAAKFDIATDAHCDLTVRSGFMMAVSLVLRLKEGGFIMAGPPCSLWTFLSSSYHKRTLERPQGDESNMKVQISNLIVRNLVALLQLATRLNVYWIIEQPSSSETWIYPPMADLLQQCGARRVHTALRAFGHCIMQPTIL